MARQLKDGVGTVWVKPKNGGSEMVAFAEGDDVPDWAAKQMGDHCFEGSDEDGDKGYADQSVEELQALVDERELEVEGTGKDGNVLKKDLVAALEADDEA